MPAALVAATGAWGEDGACVCELLGYTLAKRNNAITRMRVLAIADAS
jgi:hypothetical protein